MTTRKAFEYVISQADCHKRTGIRHSSITKYRNWCKGIGTNAPTINKMEQIIQVYGGKKIQETQWFFHNN